ncbi:MAG: hypothetical protein L0228_07785 [Planctomycetes bacterium]|nr:hypothetical protein [Planctomycetota bacterium]
MTSHESGQPHEHHKHGDANVAHSHDHHHGEDSYYIDQLCMVALTGAFGGICLALYFWQTTMLSRMLGQQFHPYVLASGIVLVGLAVLRSLSLWVQVGKEAPHAHDHQHHEHEHGHEHSHDCCHDHDHDNAHNHEHAPLALVGEGSGVRGEHAHDHAHHHHEHHHHGHSHGDHSHADHDHGWAPWRYVVLLVPIMLFLLGLPNKGPSAGEFKDHIEVPVDVGAEAQHAVSLVGAAGVPFGQIAYATYMSDETGSGEVLSMDFKNLEAAATNPFRREDLDKKNIRVIGQFAPNPNPHVFGLVRHKIQCCAADAIRLDIPIVSKEPITHVKPDAWVAVTGRVEFLKRGDSFRTIVKVPGKHAVVSTPPDSNPYLN